MRLGYFIALISLFMTGICSGVVEESGDFVVEVERLRDLAFGSGSGLYVPPTPSEQTNFAVIATQLRDGNVELAATNAAALGYEVVAFTDTNTALLLYGLREILVSNEQTRGWGSYFVNLDRETDILVEVPHPIFDTRSWDVAARVFIDTRAAGFLMAGSHRNANGSGTADVAHLTNSIFHSVHQAWNGNSGEHMAWQIHGFNVDNHPSMPINTDAVLSNGDGGVSKEIILIDASLETNAFVSYAYNTLATNSPANLEVNNGLNGTNFAGLGATLNVQGIHSRGIGGRFVHIELEQSIRFNASNRVVASELISHAVRAASEVPPRIESFSLTGATQAMLRVESLVRTRQYQVQAAANLRSPVWVTNANFTADAATTNLAVDSSVDALNFRLLLED